MRRSLARVGHRRPVPAVELPPPAEERGVPAVSIIVATFNRSNVLRIAIDSIRDQSFADWEVLVVGDCCTDDTRQVVQAFRDSRIRFVNLPENSGDQSTPNSVGIRLARGRYLAWLNHDDLWMPDHLETLVAELEAHEADIAVAPCFRVAELSERPSPGSGSVQAPVAAWPLRIFRGDVFLTSGWLMRRTLASRLGDWKSANAVRYASSQEYFYRAWSSGARIVLGSRRSVVVIPSIVAAGAYPSRRDREQLIAARLVRSGGSDAFTAMVLPGSGALVSPVVELPVQTRRRDPLTRWIIRHRATVFRVTAPIAVRIGVAPWEYAALLVGMPRGGFRALLSMQRSGAADPQSRQVNEN